MRGAERRRSGYYPLTLVNGGCWKLYVYPDFDAAPSKTSLSLMLQTCLHKQVVMVVSHLNKLEGQKLYGQFMERHVPGIQAEGSEWVVCRRGGIQGRNVYGSGVRGRL